MRKLFKMLIALLGIYLLIQIGFKIWGKGHRVKYKIESDGNYFNVEEIFVSNTHNENDSYFFNIEFNNKNFQFQTYKTFDKRDIVIEDIKYYAGSDYECLLPIFLKNTIVMDMMCFKDNLVNYYHNISGLDKELDEFVKNIDVEQYDLSKWDDNKTESHKFQYVSVYPKNLLLNQYLGFYNYKGVSTLNHINSQFLYNIELFGNDIYKRDIELVYDNYYIVADYDQKHEFDKLIMINLLNNSDSYINLNKKLSFESYIQGVINGNVYIYDEYNKRQYEFNVKKRVFIEIGNKETGVKIFKDSKWERVNVSKLNNEKVYFSDEDNNLIVNENKTNVGGFTGYTYYFEKTNGGYNVFRSPNREPKIKTLLFKTTKIDNVKYIDDYIYFIDGNLIKFYNDETGVKTLLKNEELDFNNNINYWPFLK